MLIVFFAALAAPVALKVIFRPYLPDLSFLGSLSFVPAASRLRRILSDGYHVDDLHAALREHQLARSEEIEYERRQGSLLVRRGLRMLLLASLGGTALGVGLAVQYFTITSGVTRFNKDMLGPVAEMEWQTLSMLFFSLAGVTASGVPLAGEFIRHRLSSRIAAASIAFWKSRWGARIAKLVGIGLAPAERPMLGMPVLTEVALGRATDHLFNALPKAARRELAALPEIVRRLEGDASRRRDSISALDDQLAAFERGGDALDGESRSAIEADLRSARSLAAERLAATVAALESIRLDLLRLQLGSAPIESVTATLDQARRIGDRIGESIAARREVEQLLLDTRERTEAVPRPPSALGDDADTPVEGVPATRA